MSGTYEIHWDTAANRLEFKLVGMFTDAEFDQWDAVLRAEILKAPRPGWTLLADITQSPPQKEDVQKKAEATMGFGFAHSCARTVFVTSKMVVAMQAKRFATGVQMESRVGFVSNRQEALDWLASGKTTALR